MEGLHTQRLPSAPHPPTVQRYSLGGGGTKLSPYKEGVLLNQPQKRDGTGRRTNRRNDFPRGCHLGPVHGVQEEQLADPPRLAAASSEAPTPLCVCVCVCLCCLVCRCGWFVGWLVGWSILALSAIEKNKKKDSRALRPFAMCVLRLLT